MVQCEDGYTQIANELLEAILRYPFNKRELKIVLAVIRKTYGWRKKVDDISLSQLQTLTSIDVAHLSRAVNSLVEKQVLLKEQGQYAQRIGLNKKYGQWRVLLKQQGGCRKSKEGVAETARKGLPKQQPQKKLPKETTKRNTSNKFDAFWKEYPKKVEKKKSKDIWKRKHLDNLADQIIENVVSRRDQDQQWRDGYIPHPTTFLNGERWDDEFTANTEEPRDYT